MTDTPDRSAIAFVRTKEVPPAPPPPNAAGPMKWVKDNLFAPPANSVLTILAFLAIYMILSGTVPWMLNGVWEAPSLAGKNIIKFLVITLKTKDPSVLP